MSYNYFTMIKRAKNNKGFYFLSLLMALVIIMILMGHYLGGDKEQPKPDPLTYIDKGKSTACIANRNQIETNIQMWLINHPGETPTIEKLRQSGYSVPQCPEGGVYTIKPDGKTICSKHSP